MRRSISCEYSTAGGDHFSYPTAAIFRQKCARWHFENATGRKNMAKARPMEPKMLSTGRDIVWRSMVPRTGDTCSMGRDLQTRPAGDCILKNKTPDISRKARFHREAESGGKSSVRQNPGAEEPPSASDSCCERETDCMPLSFRREASAMPCDRCPMVTIRPMEQNAE